MKKLYLLSMIVLSLSLYGSDFAKTCEVVRSNNSVKLEALLTDTKLINFMDINGRTLLFCAAETGAYKSAELLLKKGIDPNLKDEQNLTVFNVLIEKENKISNGMEQYDYIKMALLLLEYGANVNSTDKYGNTLLMGTYSPEIVRLLLSYGADVNSTNKNGENALFYFGKDTSFYGGIKISLLKSLVDYGTDFKGKDKDRKRVFDYLRGDIKYSFFKYTHYPKKLESKIVKDFLILAMKNHDYDMVELLLKMGDYANERDAYYKEPLIFKAIDNSKTLGIFLKYGLDVNIKSNYSNLWKKTISTCAVESARLLIEHQPKGFDNFQTISKFVYCKDENKSVQIADLLFSKGVKTSISDRKGHTLLHLAARESKGELCQYFLDKGIAVDVKDKDGATPVFYALASGKKNMCADILLKAGADIHQKAVGNITLLHAAVGGNRIDIVKQLLAQGLDPNDSDDKGHNALQLAAKNNNINMIKLLHNKGANLKALDADGDSVLHYASLSSNSMDTIKFLLDKGLDIDIKNKKGQTALFNTVKKNNLEVAACLIDNKANINLQENTGNTPLHLAVKKFNKKMVVLLLLKGADQSIKSKEGLSVLELANKEHSHDKEEYQKILSGEYQSYLLDDKSIFLFKELEDIVLYVANGGKIIVKDDNNQTLLHTITKQYGDEEVVNYLLLQGLDINIQDGKGRTALHFSVEFSSDDVVRILLQQGADVNIQDNDTLKAVDYLVEKTDKRKGYALEILKGMLVHGLKSIPSKNSKGKSLLNEVASNSDLVSFLLKNGLDANIIDKDGYTPLIKCAVHNYDKSAKLLLDAGANPDIQEKRGRTALYTSTVLKSYETAEILLENSANGDLQTNNSDTPLMNAVRKNDHKMTSLLLKYNTDPNITNKQKDTVLHLAVINANESIVKALLEKKSDPNQLNDMGLSPMDYAKKLKLTKIIAMFEPLIKVRKDIRPQDDAPVTIKQMPENNISVQDSAPVDNKYMQTKLHQAVASQDIDKVKKILNDSTDVNTVDKLGRTPLHYAAIRGDINIAKILIDKGADINAVDKSKQWTPLFFAVFMHHDKMAEMLIEKGANQTVKDKFDRTVNDYKKDK